MEFELKPCPFCGMKPQFSFQEYMGDIRVNEWVIDCWEIECQSKAGTYGHKYKYQAVNAWNRRWDE